MMLLSFLRSVLEFFFGDPIVREELRQENELRDMLERMIADLGGAYSRAEGMRLAGLAITAGKTRAVARGTEVSVEAFALIEDLGVATGSLRRAWDALDHFGRAGLQYFDFHHLNRSLADQSKMTIVISADGSSWAVVPSRRVWLAPTEVH